MAVVARTSSIINGAIIPGYEAVRCLNKCGHRIVRACS